jgi:hypothetical protein
VKNFRLFLKHMDSGKERKKKEKVPQIDPLIEIKTSKKEKLKKK